MTDPMPVSTACRCPPATPISTRSCRGSSAVPALDADALEAEHIAVLGRKSGALTAALKALATLPVEERKRYGAARQPAQGAVRGGVRRARARRSTPSGARREAAGVDLTMPGRRRWVGAEHPVTRVVDEIVEIFRELGFAVATGPEVETEWYNFLALNFPADHPAMDMHDTLYLDAPPVDGRAGGTAAAAHPHLAGADPDACWRRRRRCGW